MVGRSHGIHGEPISFGFKLAIWYEEACRHRERLHARSAGDCRREALRRDGHVRASRAGGGRVCLRQAGAHAGPGLQSNRAARPPCRLCVGAGAACCQHRKDCDRDSPSATDRGARSGGVFFGRTERVVGDAAQTESDRLGESLRIGAVVRANSLAAMENVALWHERDISHSSVERVIMPDSTILIDYMLARSHRPHQASGRLPGQYETQPRTDRRTGLFATAAVGAHREGRAAKGVL